MTKEERQDRQRKQARALTKSHSGKMYRLFASSRDRSAKKGWSFSWAREEFY